MIKICWIWLFVTSYLIQTNQMYIVFDFDFHSCVWIFYIVARGINFTKKKNLSYLFPFAITHIFHGRFASVHRGLSYSLLYYMLFLSCSRLFFLFLRTPNVYFYCYYSRVCILVLEEEKNAQREESFCVVWFSIYRSGILRLPLPFFVYIHVYLWIVYMLKMTTF